MFRQWGGIAVLGALFFIAAEIGSSLSQVVTIFSIFLWTVAACLIVYLMLFRGVKITMFSKKEAPPANDDDAFEVDDAAPIQLHHPEA